MIELKPGEQIIITKETNGQVLENLLYIASARCPQCRQLITKDSDRSEYRAYELLQSAKLHHLCENKKRELPNANTRGNG